ncbi:MAG TPA: CopG family antitoxin [Pyrinomonadaceae bacterium]
MTRSKSSISKAKSYKEIGEYWDSHDLGENWDETEPAEFEVSIQGRANLVALDEAVKDKLTEIARSKKVPVEVLVNEWLKEKIASHHK